jgi:FtsP/CotA-like multicopper oxidase with cupredoxin domain
MNSTTWRLRRTWFLRRPILAAIVAATALLLGLSLTAAAPAAAPLAVGPVSGTSCTPSCDLWAETGTIAGLPGAPAAGISVWGYRTSAAAAVAPGGPTLVVNQGDAVSITLHNAGIPSATSLMIAGQPGAPDTAGVTMGGSKVYSFAAGALKPGTYLYEAGLTPDGPRQVAMGLYGALIVRPAGAPAQAYPGATTAFNDEAVLVLSEIDPAFNAAPMTYDLGAYAPTYWLINGKAYPNTDQITTAEGNKVLLRYVNAGLQHHSMGLLGLHQTIIAADAQPLANQALVVAETVPTGGTLDTIVAMPASAPAGTRYALIEEAMHLDNSGASSGGMISFGGMMTFLSVGTATAAPVGPATSAVGLAPNPSNGVAAVALSATATASAGNVAAAEYFIDALGAGGSGTGMAGTFGAPVAAVNATISPAQLAGLSSGSHTFYVHTRDSNGVWGAFASAVLNLDKAGPTISNASLTPSASNGTTNVQIQATASDVATGNQNVTAAEYNIDGGAATAFTIAPATVVSLAASIPAATVLSGLAQGTHQLNIRAQDALGNWGAFSTLNLVVDRVAPNATSVSTGPAGPTNGTFGVQFGTGSNGNLFYQRVDATITDPAAAGVSSNVVAAEYFFDTDPGQGKAGSMDPADGSFNSPSETVVFPVPIVSIAALSDGTHTIYVRGKDAAGNWGATGSIALVVDKTAPGVSALTLAPNVLNSGSVAIGATATDPLFGGVHSNIAAAEYFIDAIGGVGTGTPLTVTTPNATASGLSATIPATTVAALSSGAHTVYVRAEDVATNWSALISASLIVDRAPPTFSGITLTPSSIAAGTASLNMTVGGASDGSGGSGVTGGEYWICSPTCANPAAGGATAFALPGTVAIPTGALLAGQQYTVRARIHDAVGNWSAGANGIRSAVLTVTPASNIFTDGFESGVLPGSWSSRSTTSGTRLSVTPAAAMFGANGLQAQGNSTNYVQYNVTAAATYDARFSFNPHNNASTGQDIFAAATSNAFGTQLFHVRYRRNGNQPQVQIQVGAAANPNWVAINNNASNTIEVVWQSGGTLRLSVNGTPQQTLTASAGSVGAVRLGSVTSGGSSTAEYFDAFASKSTLSPLLGQ